MAWTDWFTKANGGTPFYNNSDLLLGAGLGLLSGGTPQEQVANAARNVVNDRRLQMTNNKTLDYLRRTRPDIAQAVEAGAIGPADAWKLALESKTATPKDNLMGVGGSIYNVQTGEWITPPKGAGSDAEYGLNPIYGVDDKGNPVILQTSKSGQVGRAELPSGVTLSKDPIRMDTGTGYVLMDPITRQQIGFVPKDLAGAEQQKAQGEAEGKANAAAPGDLQAGLNAKALVQQIRSDPNLDRGTGFSSMGNVIPGTAGYDFQNVVDQAKSGAFLTAVQQMRGLGALSNAEGGAATAAITRMNTATSKEAFLSALSDYERIIDQGIARAESRMGDRTLKGPQAPRQAADPLGIR